MIRTPSKKVALLSTRQAFQYDMPVRERFDPTGYVQGTFDIEELEETKETSKTLTGTLGIRVCVTFLLPHCDALDCFMLRIRLCDGTGLCQWPVPVRKFARS